MSDLAALRKYAIDRGLDVYEVSSGLGVRFLDGFDIYWSLSDEQWHFLSKDTETDRVTSFIEINERRQKVVEAIRRYLAKQNVATGRYSNGHWSILTGAASSELYVGAYLTRTLTTTPDLTVAVQSVFEGSFVRKPSEKRAERHLAEFGEPLKDIAWPEEEETVIKISETPFTALGWMGLCKALKKESSFDSPEAFVKAAEPKGRIGHALLQVAQRLPNKRATVEITNGSMCIEFTDGYDSFDIAPKSRELRELVRSMSPEEAGNQLADEYEQLDKDRSEAIRAILVALNSNGFFKDFVEENHVGRDVREFVLDLGDSLTDELRKSGKESAVRLVLNENTQLADQAVTCLSESSEDVTLQKRVLLPTVPKTFELPQLTDGQMTALDERSYVILREYLKTSDSLNAYYDPLKWDASADNWATKEEWLKVANANLGGDYPRPSAEYILIQQGDSALEERFVERLQSAEPHDEMWDQEVELVWRKRSVMPELADKWFGPQPFEDMPFAEIRARLGDPIAGRYVLDGLVEYENDPVPSEIGKLPKSLVERFVEPSQLNNWREAASQWAKETWQWNWGGDREVLAVASNMGWTEICDHLCENPFLLPGLLQVTDEDPGILFADELLLAWSKLKPSPFLMQLVGYVLSMNLDKLLDSLARRFTGTEEYIRENPQMVGDLSNIFQNKIGVALAISWHRCRKKLSTNE